MRVELGGAVSSFFARKDMPHCFVTGNFYLSGILHVAAAIAVLVFYRPLPPLVPHAQSYLTRLGQLDFVGCGIFAVGWILLVFQHSTAAAV